jgi:hypothetical protein
MTTCNCESSYCTHHKDCMCPHDATDSPYDMSFVGPICAQCANVTIANGGEKYLHPRGTVK